MAGSSAETAAGRLLAALPRVRAWGWVVLAVVVAYLLFAPVFLLESFLRTLSGVFMFATLALGWNIIGGFAGYPSFGNVVFFGLAGYTVAALMGKLGWSFWPAMVVAAMLAMAFAVLIGMPILRLRGHYFAIATLGVAEGVREIVINVPAVTGGGAGITIPALGTEATTTYPGNIGFYYFFLALLAVALGVMWTVSRSRFGFALRAIRQDEEGAAAMGIDTTRAKITAFALSALLTGAAGALYAFQQVTIYPYRLFSVEITVLMVVMAVIGGTGTVLGPLIGAVALQFLSEFLRQNYLDWNLFIFGAIIVVGVIFLPRGLVSAARETRRRKRLSLLENVRRHRL
ncbi:MAG: branched-chain amino acid ABC transporter permease [Actinomycetota bacterium]